MTTPVVRRSVTTVLLAATLGGCIRGAAMTTGCPAFETWAEDGFPGDLSSVDDGPRYLRFLAEVGDTAPPVEDQAEQVLRAAQRIHEQWIAAGGPDGPPDRVERATEVADELHSAEVVAALQDIMEYGAETCSVRLP